MYTCYAMGEAFNETLSVELKVCHLTLHGHHDTLNTAYTTLVGCILSVVLVLTYLYHPVPLGAGVLRNLPAIRQTASVLPCCLVPHPTTTLWLAGDKDDGFNWRVAFLEPAGPAQGQNASLPGNTLPVPEATAASQWRMSDPNRSARSSLIRSIVV